MADASLIASCHRAVLAAAAVHPSPEGYELLIHPALASTVTGWEREHAVSPGSFATLAGARSAVYTYGADGSFAVFCRTHMHRLDILTGAAACTHSDRRGTLCT